jgi:uncharacterized protein YdhG (YjbR/CyaY superfamily)
MEKGKHPDAFEQFTAGISDQAVQDRVREILKWVLSAFPELDTRIAWNQPIFTHHGTFIIGFSVSKKHLAVAPEHAGIVEFSQRIEQSGYEHTKELIRIKWSDDVDFNLLEQMIRFNIGDKATCGTFWRTTR